MRYDDVTRAADLVDEFKAIREARQTLERSQRQEMEVVISTVTSPLMKRDRPTLTLTRLSLVDMLLANERTLHHALHKLGVEYVPLDEPDEPAGAVADGT